jgi:hypothetical protein
VYCKDFEYDGQRLSDYECIVCRILEGGDASAINIGSQITFNTLPIASGNKFKLMSTQYTETYTATFEICKYSCLDSDNNFFTQEEVSCLMRWLNKKRFKKFKMVYEDGELADVYYNASFNVNPITYYGDIIGLQLTLQTDAPFGYYEEVEYTMEFTERNLNHSFFDTSDEIGYIYPSSMTIELLANGDFEMVNSQEDRITSIKNCKAGEIITLVENKTISSSINHSKLYNDFNYVFPRICNENEDIYGYGYATDNMENLFTVNIPCKITFKYSPICKMGIV